MPPHLYAILADAILVLHVGFASFIVVGFAAIWIGFFLKRPFVHNRWFRGAHAAAMGIVALEAVAGWFCPLTTWEYELRRLAGQPQGEYRSFMSYWAERFFYFDLPQSVFLLIYLALFLFILATFFVVPVQWRRNPRNHETRRS